MSKGMLPVGWLGVWATGVGLFAVFLMVQSAGLTPTVFSDEYAYSQLSRLIPIEEAKVPAFLYLKLFGLTNYCGSGFLVCARIMNAVLFSLAAPFIYATCRVFSDVKSAVIVTLLSMAGPINGYTAYFMPESFFFLAFWIFCAVFLRLDQASPVSRWLIAGLIYGACALVKVHAIFFLPSIGLYIVFLFLGTRSLISRDALMRTAAFVGGALAVKFGIGYFVAGQQGLTLFGRFYAAYLPPMRSYLDLLLPAIHSVKGHFWGLALLYGIPLSISLSALLAVAFRRQVAGGDDFMSLRLQRLCFFSLFLIIGLVSVSALFTASVVNAGPYETPDRLHIRYYNFALPLFYMIVAGFISSGERTLNQWLHYAVAPFIALASALAFFSDLAPFTPTSTDSPEIFGLHHNPVIFHWVAGLLLLSSLIWMVRQSLGIRLYFYLALPLMVVFSYVQVIEAQRHRLVEDAFDRAGISAKRHLSSEELSKTLVVGSDMGGLYRVLFYLDNIHVKFKPFAPGEAIDLTELPGWAEWLLVTGDLIVPEGHHFQLDLGDYRLVRVSESYAMDFRKSSWPGVISRSSGLSYPETWGTWSSSDQVELEFAMPLPRTFALHLTAHTLDAAAEQVFTVSIGSDEKTFRLTPKDQTLVFNFKDPTTDKMHFKIPKAVSPKMLGLGGDARRLGIAFVEVNVIPIDSGKPSAGVP